MSMFTRDLNRKYVIRSILLTELLLLVPLLGMLVSDDWNWSLSDFIIAGILLAGVRGGTLLFVAGLRAHKQHLTIIGAVTAFVLILLWIELAVGLFGSPLAGNTELHESKTSQQPSTSTASGSPIWKFNDQQQAWQIVSGSAPACKDPFTFDISPVDMTKVSAVSLPGAYRGYNYKAHGGFRLTDSTGGYAEIKMPMDAKLMHIGRYYEQVPGQDYELQYIIDFENDCGMAFRFDHLQTLSPAFQAYADKSPAPKKNDTSSDPNIPAIRKLFKAGEVVATRMGFPTARNYGFDFGVYDYRQPNEISKNKQWAAIHQTYSAQHFYGVCWLPLLPAADAAKAEAMAKDRNNYNSAKPFNLTSDYCNFAPHKTLEYNSGQPTDG